MALQSDNLVLRQETNAPNTTKNAELTFEELDNNFIFIYEDLKALQGSGALPAWVVSTTYSLNTVVSYDGFIWKYVNASPSAGVVPGSDPFFWVQMVPAELTHVQNSDTKLGEGTADEVSANEIRTFLDTPIVPDNLYNADGTITDPIRVVDLDGNVVQFDNGQFVIGDQIGSGYLAEINGTSESKNGLYVSTSGGVSVRAVGSSGQSINGITNNGIAVYGLANYNGIAVHGNATTAGSISGWFVGKILIEETLTSVDVYSSLFTVKSSVKGSIPFPVMTTAQKNAIVSPATGLHVFDTDFARPEFYNGSYWEGESITMNVQAAQSNPSSGATIFFGNLALQPATTGGTRKIFVRKKRVIRGAELYSRASTAGSNEAWAFYIRVNDTTDYLIQSVSVSANERIWTNMALSIELNAGDYFEIKGVNPTWGTPPASFTIAGNILLQ